MRPYRDFLARPTFLSTLLSIVGIAIIVVMVGLFWEYEAARVERLQTGGIRVTGTIARKYITGAQNDTRQISGTFPDPSGQPVPFDFAIPEADYERLAQNGSVGLVYDPATVTNIDLQSVIDARDMAEFRRVMPLRYAALIVFLVVVGVVVWFGEAFVKYRRQDEEPA